jgi:P22 coat protein - gene protein 5
VANRFLKAERIIAQGLGMLQRELILPRLVERKGIADFKGAKNDTIDIRIPSILRAREYEWRTRTRAIEVDELEETSIPVRLDKHVYSAVGITDEELTLDIDSWGEQVATPQIRATGERLEGYIAVAMENANYRHTVSWTPGTGDSDDFSFNRAANAARKFLNTENVPTTGRKLLLGANVEEAALNSPNLLKANEAAYDGTLREAVIGRIAGFDVIGNVNSIDPDFAVAFHPTAYVFGNVAPQVPGGVSSGATMTYDSFAMRWIRDYDSDFLRDRSVYSSFAGAASVEDARDLDENSSNYGDLTNENVRAVLVDFTPGS